MTYHFKMKNFIFKILTSSIIYYLLIIIGLGMYFIITLFYIFLMSVKELVKKVFSYELGKLIIALFMNRIEVKNKVLKGI